MKIKLSLLEMQHKSWANHLCLFLFCFAILFGPAYALFDSYNYDTVANPDLETYLGLAHFNFDQSLVRKYRVVIPFLAAGFNFLFSPLFSRITPHTFPGPDFSLCISFLFINCIFMSVFGMFVYRLCKEFGVSRLSAVIGLLSVLTCRWTSYLAGLPLIDSLFMLVIAMTLLGIKTKNTTLIVCSIFIGPWAKESFLFIAPLIFFYSSIPKYKQLIFFLLSGILVFSFRYYFDSLSGSGHSLGLKADFEHLENIPVSIKRLFSFHGMYEIISIFGVWCILFAALLNKNIRHSLHQHTSSYMIIFLLIVLVNALLSSELARMFYMSTPITAIWLALISDKILDKTVY